MSNPSPGYSITVRVTAPVGAGTTAALAGAVASSRVRRSGCTGGRRSGS